MQTSYDVIDIEKRQVDGTLDNFQKDMTHARNGILAVVAFVTTLLLSIGSSGLITLSAAQKFLVVEVIVIDLIVGLGLYFVSNFSTLKYYSELRKVSDQYFAILTQLYNLKDSLAETSIWGMSRCTIANLYNFAVYVRIITRERSEIVDAYKSAMTFFTIIPVYQKYLDEFMQSQIDVSNGAKKFFEQNKQQLLHDRYVRYVDTNLRKGIGKELLLKDE